MKTLLAKVVDIGYASYRETVSVTESSEAVFPIRFTYDTQRGLCTFYTHLEVAEHRFSEVPGSQDSLAPCLYYILQHTK